MIGMLIRLEKQGAAENELKQILAFVALLFECMGRDSPTRSALVLKVKKTCVRKSNERKVVVPALSKRVGCTLGDMRKMIESIYMLGASEADPCRKRFLVMQRFFVFCCETFQRHRHVEGE